MAIGQVRETLDDLMRAEGRAELIGGRIVALMPTGSWPNEVAGNIYESLKAHCRRSKVGKAFTDNVGYTVPELSTGRESFSPDVSYYADVLPRKSMTFIDGSPTFAVEVRSQDDYGPSADAKIAAKRAEYFEAGTALVWDVDPRAESLAAYTAASDQPVAVFRRGDVANAEPMVPGWSIAVDDVFSDEN